MVPFKEWISGHLGSLSSANEGQASRTLLEKFHREERWVDRKHLHSLPPIEGLRWNPHDIYSRFGG